LIPFDKSRDIKQKSSQRIERREIEMTTQNQPPESPPSATPPPLTQRQIYAIVASIIILAGAISGTLIYISLTQDGGIVPSTRSLPEIEHNPVEKGEIGKAITLQAKVMEGSDGINNVSIYYEWSEFTSSQETARSSVQHPWKTELMLLLAAEGDEYAYTIPSDEVKGDIDYFIVATDKAGFSSSTQLYTIEVSDFTLETPTDPIIVYIGSSNKATITIKPLGEFSSEVALSLSDTPYGVGASVTPDTVTPPIGGASTVQLSISASSASGTFRGTFELKITGKSGNAEHSQKVTVKVPSFDMSVSPSSQTISKGDDAEYQVTISPAFDFQKEISFKLEGLPGEEVEWEMNLSNNRISVGTETIFILKISTTTKVELDTYPLTFIAEGGGIKTDSRLTLTVK
jgi:uncharacterized membrane protein